MARALLGPGGGFQDEQFPAMAADPEDAAERHVIAVTRIAAARTVPVQAMLDALHAEAAQDSP
jgi:hypothetical protein